MDIMRGFDQRLSTLGTRRVETQQKVIDVGGALSTLTLSQLVHLQLLAVKYIKDVAEVQVLLSPNMEDHYFLAGDPVA